MKDRMALAAINGAAERGEIRPGDTVVEYTAGTTGISLALVCAAKGYKLHVVFSDAFSNEKRRTMEAFGAIVEDVPSDQGRITEKLIKAMIARAGEVSTRPGHWPCDQLNNHDAINGYLPMGGGNLAAVRRAGRCPCPVRRYRPLHPRRGPRPSQPSTTASRHCCGASRVGGTVGRADRIPSHRRGPGRPAMNCATPPSASSASAPADAPPQALVSPSA